MYRNIGNKNDYIELLRFNDCYRIEWDKQPLMVNEYDESHNIIGQYEDETNISWMEETFTRKPALEEIKNLITTDINAKTDAEILEGYKWNDIPIYLSMENQFNYKTAYDIAVMTNGTNLPVTFKFGTTYEPIYYKFETLEELTNFFTGCISFIQATLQKGWEKKDAIDWTKYDTK